MQFKVEKFQTLCYQHAQLNAIIIKYTGPGEISIPETVTAGPGHYMNNNASFHVHVANLAMKYKRLTG